MKFRMAKVQLNPVSVGQRAEHGTVVWCGFVACQSRERGPQSLGPFVGFQRPGCERPVLNARNAHAGRHAVLQILLQLPCQNLLS